MALLTSRALLALACLLAGCGGALERSPSDAGATPAPDPDPAAAPDAGVIPPSTTTPAFFVAGVGDIVDLVSDGTSLYWTDTGVDPYGDKGTVMRSALDGSNQTVLAAGQIEPSGLALDATSLYWTNVAGASNGSGSVMKLALTGGEPTVLASGLYAPDAIAVDATSLYWLNVGNGSISKLALAGGQPFTLASGQTFPGYGKGFTIDAAHVYWATTDGSIKEVALDGTGVTTLIAGRNSPQAIAVDATSIYWAEGTCIDQQCTGAVMKAALDGTNVTQLASNQGAPESIALHGGGVYWTTASGDFARSGTLGESETILYASGGEGIGSFAFAGAQAYWIMEGNPGAILRGPS